MRKHGCTCGLLNPGFWGIKVKQAMSWTVSFYARFESFGHSLDVPDWTSDYDVKMLNITAGLKAYNPTTKKHEWQTQIDHAATKIETCDMDKSVPCDLELDLRDY